MYQQPSASEQHSEAATDDLDSRNRATTPPGTQGQVTSSALLDGDSPRQDRTAPRHGLSSLDLIRQRLARVMMPEILEGPEDRWLQHYTSNCVGEQALEQVILALLKKGLVFNHEGTLRWKDFPDKPSLLREQKLNKSTEKTDGSAPIDTAVQRKTERKIFRPLGTIIDAIAAVPLPNLSPSCKYEEEPYSTDSEVSGSQHRIDGFLRLNKSTSPPGPKGSRTPTSDIAVNFEFKCSDAPQEIIDNRSKALYSAFHNLHSDCQRKHTYSITIEDNHVCLWYFSLQDVRAVVHALSALIFSTVEDLGYDANIKRISEWDEEVKQVQLRYVYRLGDRFFKTVKCRDEYDDLYISGRATRVWEVIEVTSFDNTVPLPNTQRMILRDVWLEHDGNTEREIQEKIFQRCDELGRNFPSENDERLHDVDDATRTLLHQRLKDGSYKELFLTIKADYRGAMSKPRAEGFTPKPDIFAEPVYINQEAKRHGSDTQRASSSRSHTLAGTDLLMPFQQQAGAPREYKPKQRNFVVYEEVCSALHELDDMHDVIQALLDAVLALQILFLISWIHRDVSSGNILSFKGRGKLCDLEYAKEFDLSVGGRSSDPKTGTPIFMAVELQYNAAIYGDAGFSEDMQDNETRESPLHPSPTVRHNFQHDLESIFWILAWLVFTHIPGQICANVTAELFHSKRPGFLPTRWKVLIHHYVCAEWLQTLRADLPPVLAKGLLTMRNILYQRYLKRGRSIGDTSTYSPIYDKFRKVLRTIATSVPRGRVRLLFKKMDEPEDNTVAPHKAANSKRARGTSNAGEVDAESRPEKRLARG
ncbi:hypothetical protein ONZ51_g5384 [Trametes cubensis]|uniref:Fungal-type protein kinase domain-containing protein n=1 Tax=Trametes cubensis TaxID=1111947 RepID=A0AAD7TU12_9APHY|nr:hypothetical protein ONZ51_g5384 [Trametes cubensis]